MPQGIGAESGRLFAVLLAEALDTAGSVDNLLLAGVERMAGGADFDVQWLDAGGLSGELVATAAGDFDLAVVRVDGVFHFIVLSSAGAARGFGEPTEPGIIR
jgi:hypothetical protein